MPVLEQRSRLSSCASPCVCVPSKSSDDLLAQCVYRVVDLAADRRSARGANLVADLHRPGRRDLGDFEGDRRSASVVTYRRLGK